jgi:hypothetical protein
MSPPKNHKPPTRRFLPPTHALAVHETGSLEKLEFLAGMSVVALAVLPVTGQELRGLVFACSYHVQAGWPFFRPQNCLRKCGPFV